MKKPPAPPPAALLPPPAQFEKAVQYRGPGAKAVGGAPAGGGGGAGVMPTTGSLMSPVGSVINSLFGGKKPGML